MRLVPLLIADGHTVAGMTRSADKADAVRAAGLDEMERMVLDAGGVVLRYGQFYGPGTFFPDGPPPPPGIHVDEAARRTLPALDMASTVLTTVED